MTTRNMEKLAAEKRMRQRGTESVHESGLGMVRGPQDQKQMDQLAERIGRWRKEPSIEEAVEKARHVPERTLNGRTRAETDDWTRAILDSCED